jgi:EAL domain-containing protein (putative c-di-GMP-specific phosphodiesterase class I)/CheY-like chemotaxis protein
MVDDDEQMLELQMRMLHSMGYSQTISAGSAKDALLQLEYDPHSAQVIVCDLNMPEMDGIEFLQALNASPFRGSVILLSGESKRIMHSVQKLLGGRQLTILGVLTKPPGRREIRALLDCWRTQTEPTASSHSLAVSADDLRAANRDQQWVLHFQPQVSLTTGALVGMEALVRWNHPDQGLVYPGEFIAKAEDCGVIDDLTNWVVNAAMKQRAMWAAQGLMVRMAVNISMESLHAPNFWRRFTALVRDAGVAPQDVTVEVTESRIMPSSRVALENLIRLQLQRFTLSIDDFGTGHSSLAQLRDVPFAELKIDQGFVSGAHGNQIVRPILEGSLGIAKRMGMISVAEGVETSAEWELLRQLDCDLAQGYLIGRPMSVEAVWDWLSAWKARYRDLSTPT